MGAYICAVPARDGGGAGLLLSAPVPAFVLIGFWFITQLFSGFSTLGVDAVGAGGGVAYFAHIGGFIAGALLISFFTLGQPRPSLGRRTG